MAPGATITNSEAAWRSRVAAERLGPLRGANIPALATAAHLAPSITSLFSDDGANVNGAIQASGGGWSALWPDPARGTARTGESAHPYFRAKGY